MRIAHSAALCMTAALLLPACVYRADTQQGNLLDDAQVQQVELGMTRSQVRFLMGTPMVSDPFSRDRWDYTYYFRKGRGDDVTTSHVIVHFEGDVVSRIDRPAPQPAPAADPASPPPG